MHCSARVLRRTICRACILGHPTQSWWIVFHMEQRQHVMRWSCAISSLYLTGTEEALNGLPPPGIERGTFCLQDRCSTTEPHRRDYVNDRDDFEPRVAEISVCKTTRVTAHSTRRMPTPDLFMITTTSVPITMWRLQLTHVYLLVFESGTRDQ